MKDLRIEIEIGKKKKTANIRIPESWNEVPVTVYPELCSIYLKKPEEMSEYDKAVRAFILLTVEHYDIVKELQAEELYDLLHLTEWVSNRLDLTKNIKPSIDIDGKIFHGPSDEMENLRFGEWCIADTHLVNYAKTGDIANLWNLAACIYRPAGIGPEFTPGDPSYRGDIRQKFNDQLLSARVELMSRLKPAVLHGIYIFFASCKHKITTYYPLLFPQKQVNESTATPAPKNEQPYSWFDIYDDLRGDPKFGGAEKLEDEFIHTVFASIERSKKTMKELKSKYKI